MFVQCLRGPHLIISFFQYFLTFNITSLNFYYSSNKKITTKQNFSFFYIKHFDSFTFSKKKKKKNTLTFFNFCYDAKLKPNKNRLPNKPPMVYYIHKKLKKLKNKSTLSPLSTHTYALSFSFQGKLPFLLNLPYPQISHILQLLQNLQLLSFQFQISQFSPSHRKPTPFISRLHCERSLSAETKRG
jgi:hypothetical protein